MCTFSRQWTCTHGQIQGGVLGVSTPTSEIFCWLHFIGVGEGCFYLSERAATVDTDESLF